jgi:protein SCO1/2
MALAALLPACKREAKHYLLKGQVVQRNPATSEITVKHDAIPGFMAAMTMPYKVKTPLMAEIVEPGDMIAADLVPTEDGKEYWLDNLRITDISGRKNQKAVPAAQMLTPGEHVPDIELTNQDGKIIHLADFKGKALLVTFIYTRCPLPNFCPRLSSQFAKIQTDLAKMPDDYARTHLLTISFDPKYDTPEVLRKYGLAYLHDDASGFSHWDFASTAPDKMEKLAATFGLAYLEEDNQITHSMSIVLIAPDGTISKYWTNEWTASELEDALRQAARKKA